MKSSGYANLVAALAGAAALVLIETVLQVAEVGPANRLFVEDEENAQEVYRLNPRVAHRFFPHQYVRLPPFQVRFTRDKRPGAFRVFALGASTLLGFPNPPDISFPHFFQLMLEDAYAGGDFEVINCGITAINSFCILDFVEEIVEYEPDLLIIYAGHNEFVGPYGVTTPFVRFGNDWNWIRFHMLLQRSKIFFYLKELLYYFQNRVQDQEEDRGFGLHLVRKEVELGSEEYQVTEENFRRNLQETMERAGKRGIPVLLSTLVSNLRGFYPLRSQAPHPQRDPLEGPGGGGEKADYCDSLLRQFPHHAGAHFQAGEVFYQARDFARARQAFVEARDLDLIRFRACSSFNRTIREVAAEAAPRGAILVDMEELFAQASPHGIVGSELIAEHLHPTVFGHFLMARYMVQTVVRDQERLGLGGGELERLGDFEGYSRRLGYGIRKRVFSRNDLIFFLRDMPYEKRPRILRETLAELVSLQLEELLKLSYGEIQVFARKGGVGFLAQTIEILDPADQERLGRQLEELVVPLGIDPQAPRTAAP